MWFRIALFLGMVTPTQLSVLETPKALPYASASAIVGHATHDAREALDALPGCYEQIIRNKFNGSGVKPHPDLAKYVVAASAHPNATELLAVAWIETRVKPLIGDQGRACGVFQYHSRYHPEIKSLKRKNEDVCAQLLRDPVFATATTVERLKRYAHICHYNQGGRCLKADLAYKPGSYSWKVREMKRELDTCHSTTL